MKTKESLDNYDYSKTDRSLFNESFLLEMPQLYDPAEYFDNLNMEVQEYIDTGHDVIKLENGLCKIDCETLVFYWFEKDGIRSIIVTLDKTPRTLAVRLLGKKDRGSPYAIDLYLGILKDVGRNITIMSDNQITEKGFNVWQRLFSAGHKVTVYDKNFPGSTWKTVKSLDELGEYLGSEYKYRNYRYVLSESKFVTETRSYFRLRQIREESGSALTD